MRFARKLMLLAIAAIAAMAFAAPASATEQVQVVDEDDSMVCSSIDSPHLTGGCVVHAAGTVELEAFFFGFESHESRCDVELMMRVSGNGVAAVDSMRLDRIEANTDTTCTATPATVEGCDFPWEGRGEEDAADPVGHLESVVNVCLDPAEAGTCVGELSFEIVESAGEHYSTVFANSRIGTSVCELNGSLEIEHEIPTNEEIHVNHP